MTEIASRELRNNTRGVITVDGLPVAALRPLHQRPRWINGAEFARRVAGRQADPALRDELKRLAPDTTDDISF